MSYTNARRVIDTLMGPLMGEYRIRDKFKSLYTKVKISTATEKSTS